MADSSEIWPNQPSVSEIVASRSMRTAFATGEEVGDGVRLRFEQGRIPELTARTAGKIAMDANDFVKSKRDIDNASAAQAGPAKELKESAAIYRGLRGVASERNNYLLDIRSACTVNWNQEALRTDFGPNYTALVHERLRADVSLPLGIETDEGPLTQQLVIDALRRGLATLGFKREDAEKIIRTEVSLEVDEKELAKMLANEQVKLSPEAASVSESFSIVVNPLNKNLPAGG